MSASRAPIFLEPVIGLPVLIEDESDCQHGHLGWITHLGEGVARVTFAPASGWIPRWFQVSELRDARVAATEPVCRMASAGAAMGATCRPAFDGLEWIEALTWLRAPTN